MRTRFLSAKEKESGQKTYVQYSGLNGFGFALLGDTLIYLLAMEFSASNLQLGYISAAIHITGLVLPFIPWLLRGKNLRDVLFVSWIIRGLASSLYAVLLFTGDPGFGSWWVVAVYSLFCLFRSVGAASSEALQKTLVTHDGTGMFLIRTNLFFQASKLVSQVFSFFYFLINAVNNLFGLISLIFLGVVANTVSALKIRDIPCRETIEYNKGDNFIRVLARNFATRTQALPFVIRWISLVLLVQGGFWIPFLKKTAGLDTNLVFAVTVLMSLAAMAGNSLMKPFADRIGSKFLLSVSASGLALLFFAMAMVPESVSVVIFFLLGFLYSLFLTVTFLVVSRIVITSIPENDKMNFSSAMNFSAAFFSLMGGILGGLLADASATWTVFGDYDLPFLFAGLLSVSLMLISLFVDEVGGMTIREAAQVVFSSRNLKAFMDVYQLDNASSRQKRQTLLYNIGHSGTPVATAEVRRILRNPYSPDKAELFRHLFFSPARSLLPQIISDALDPGSYTRKDSIFALGACPGKQTETVLLSLVDDPNPLIFSNSVKSLARIGYHDPAIVKKITTVFPFHLEYPEVILNYLIALFIVDREGEVLSEIFSYPYPGGLAKTVFSLLSSLMEAHPALSVLYRMEAESRGSGLQVLLDESRDLTPFLRDSSFLYDSFMKNRISEIHDWVLRVISDEAGMPDSSLRRSLCNQNGKHLSFDTVFACLYFTFVLLS